MYRLSDHFYHFMVDVSEKRETNSRKTIRAFLNSTIRCSVYNRIRKDRSSSFRGWNDIKHGANTKHPIYPSWNIFVTSKTKRDKKRLKQYICPPENEGIFFILCKN